MFFVPFWINFSIQYKERVQLHSSACEHSVNPAPFADEIINGFNTFAKNQLAICMNLFLFHRFMSIIIPAPHFFHYCSSLVSFEIKKRDSLCSSFQYCFCHVKPLWISHDFKIRFEFISGKKCLWDLDRDCTETRLFRAVLPF